MSITLILADDDSFVTASLATIINAQDDMEVLATGHNGAEAVRLYEQHEPDLLLLDIQMPGMGGLEAARTILATHPKARIVFLTTFASDEYIVAALRMGARGYLIKQEVATIAPALRLVMSGQSVLGGEVMERLGNATGQAGAELLSETAANFGSTSNSLTASDKSSAPACPACPTPPVALQLLTERELEIVEQVAAGLDNRDIAARLFLSEGTVRNHISAILTKLALKNRTQLAIRYYQSERGSRQAPGEHPQKAKEHHHDNE